MTRLHALAKPLSTTTFHAIAELTYRESGLTLVKEKAKMVQSRLNHRLLALGMDNFCEYVALLESSDGLDERRQLISALTTNVSYFNRESHHFDTLNAFVATQLPGLRAGGVLRIWSAGCSNGQEPLSIALNLLEAHPEVAKLDVRILATDIDPKVISFAKITHYSERQLHGLSDHQRDQFFSALPKPVNGPTFAVRSDVSSMIRYNELNLLGSWPMRGRFDAILCRNTMIYFDSETQRALWPRFRLALKPDGLLFLGHSERITDPATFGFGCTGPTTYQARHV